MHLGFTDEQVMISETVANLFRQHATAPRTRAAMESGRGMDQALWECFARELGFAGIALPSSYGGSGLGHVELAILAEAAGEHVAAIPLLGTFCSSAAVAAGGSERMRSRWLPKVASGAAIGSFAIAGDLQQQNGRLSGTVRFVPHGAAADYFVIDLGDEVALVDRASEGVTLPPVVTMDQTRPLSTLRLESVAYENFDDIGAAAIAARMTAWLLIAADALGGAQACLDRTVSYALQRVQFGRRIGAFQAVKHRLADMMVEVEQARSAVYWAAGASVADARLAAHSAKAFACDSYSMCAGNMIQLHGAIGFTWEHDAHLFFKRARTNRTLFGAPNWHREQVAQLIGLDDSP